MNVGFVILQLSLVLLWPWNSTDFFFRSGVVPSYQNGTIVQRRRTHVSECHETSEQDTVDKK